MDTSGGSADARRFPAKRPLVHRAMSQQALAGKPSASQDDSSNVTPETTQARPPSSMSRPPIFSLRTHFIHGPCSTTMPRLCRPVRRIGTLFSRSCLRRPAAPTGCQDVLGSSQPTSWSKGFWGGAGLPEDPGETATCSVCSSDGNSCCDGSFYNPGRGDEGLNPSDTRLNAGSASVRGTFPCGVVYAAGPFGNSNGDGRGGPCRWRRQPLPLPDGLRHRAALDASGQRRPRTQDHTRPVPLAHSVPAADRGAKLSLQSPHLMFLRTCNYLYLYIITCIIHILRPYNYIHH